MSRKDWGPIPNFRRPPIVDQHGETSPVCRTCQGWGCDDPRAIVSRDAVLSEVGGASVANDGADSERQEPQHRRIEFVSRYDASQVVKTAVYQGSQRGVHR